MSNNTHDQQVFLEISKICQKVFGKTLDTDQAILEIQKILNLYINQESQKNTGLTLETALPQLLSFEKKAYLLPLVENYKLSITHLNNFLDVSRGGPENFVNQNLLSIPMGQNLASKYGSAIHLILNKFIQEWRGLKGQSVQVAIPDLKDLLQDVPKYIKEHLKKPSEAIAHIPKAERQLADFYEQVLLILADFFVSSRQASKSGDLVLKYYQSPQVYKTRYQRLIEDQHSKLKAEAVKKLKPNLNQENFEGVFGDTNFENKITDKNSIHDLILQDILDSYRHSIKNLAKIHSGMGFVGFESDFDHIFDAGAEELKASIQKHSHGHDPESGEFLCQFDESGSEPSWNSLQELKSPGLKNTFGDSFDYNGEYRFVGMETEVDFGYEKIILDPGGQLEAHLSGKIDFLEKYLYNTIRPEKGFLVVNDFKTGKPLEKWKNSAEDERVKSWKLENQLLYYQILCQNSNRYQGYKVSMGRLIFVEAQKNWQNSFLEMEMDEQKSKTLSRLAQIVYQKIIHLDFPDTSYYLEKYDNKMDAILAFVDDLLEGKV